MADYRVEFEDWCDKWDKAQKEGIFKDTSPVKPQDSSETNKDNARDAYWANIDREAKLMQEDHAGSFSNKEEMAHQAKDMARAANPIYHHTSGMDQELKPWTPNWIDGKELEELAQLKAELYDLECECNKKDAIGEGASSVQTKIKSMWEKLNRLSNDLTPDRFKEILD